MNTANEARPRALPDDFDDVRDTLQWCKDHGYMPTVKRLAARFPKRLTAHQRDVLARTMRQYGRTS